MDAVRESRRPDVEQQQARAQEHDALTSSDQVPPAAPLSEQSNSIPHPLPTHPSNFDFDFPTLNLDGSLSDLSDLTAHQSASTTYPPTPPAALSSLGAKAKMDQKDNMSDAGESFADDQYDMIEDLSSEMSTDDHDTASIASTDEPGQITPDDAGSEADLDESTLLLDHDDAPTPPSTSQSLVDISIKTASPAAPSAEQVQAQRTKKENDLIDSYMSEDLDTPRQSTMAPMPSFSSRSTIKSLQASRHNVVKQPDNEASSILFISNRDAPEEKKSLICSKVECCMNAPVSTRHCVDATIRENGSGGGPSYQLQILNIDDEYSSYYAVNGGKIDLRKPDIAVIYMEPKPASSWMTTAYKAVSKLAVPVLIVHDNGIKTSRVKKLLQIQTNSSHKVIQYDDVDSHKLSVLIDKIVYGRLPTEPSAKPRFALEKKLAKDIFICLLFTFLATLAIPSFSLNLLFAADRPLYEIPLRRGDLRTALSKAVPSSNVSKEFDIAHLLPESSVTCIPPTYFWQSYDTSNCRQEPHYQGVAPNHFVISMPIRPRVPQVVKTTVLKSDGRPVAFNQTKLIEGVYLVTFDPDEAFDTVTVSMLTKKPDQNVTAPHNFGNRLLQRTTYEKAGAEIGKAVSTEVTVMRDVAKSLTEKLSTELGASMWATKNVTTQLALYVSRELQVLGNTGVSFLGKAARAGNQTASALSKDFVLVQKDVARFTKDLSTMVKSRMELAKNSSKALIRNPVAVSRERLQDFKKVFGRKVEAAAHKKVSKPQAVRKTKFGCRAKKEGKGLSFIPKASTPSKATSSKSCKQQPTAATKRSMKQTDAKAERQKLKELKDRKAR